MLIVGARGLVREGLGKSDSCPSGGVEDIVK